MSAITRDCPIECLASLLSRSTLAALVDGVEGSPATVGQVVELYEQGRLPDIYDNSSGRVGEIRWCLTAAKLVEADARLVVRRRYIRETKLGNGHHLSCPGGSTW